MSSGRYFRVLVFVCHLELHMAMPLGCLPTNEVEGIRQLEKRLAVSTDGSDDRLAVLNRRLHEHNRLKVTDCDKELEDWCCGYHDHDAVVEMAKRIARRRLLPSNELVENLNRYGFNLRTRLLLTVFKLVFISSLLPQQL